MSDLDWGPAGGHLIPRRPQNVSSIDSTGWTHEEGFNQFPLAWAMVSRNGAGIQRYHAGGVSTNGSAEDQARRAGTEGRVPEQAGT